MSTIHVGVVGVGALGQHHARILAEIDNVTLAGVADTRPDVAVAVAEQCRCRAYGDYRELLPRVDAAVIAVPTTAHEDVATDFLRRGIPVLVEKPLAAHPAEAERLVALAGQSRTLLQVGHIERFNPVTPVAWPLIDAPRYIRAERYSPFAFRSMDIGVVLDVMIHDIDLILDLVAAPVQSVHALGTAVLGAHEDCVQARLTFADGCVADLFANRIHPDTQRTLQVFCSSRMVSVDFHARSVTCYHPTERLLHGPSPIELASRLNADIPQLKSELFGSFIGVETPPVPTADALTEELQSFVHCIRTGSPPLVGGTEALRAMQTAGDILAGLDKPQTSFFRKAA